MGHKSKTINLVSDKLGVMKKLLTILVLGLLWGNVGFAEIYTFDKCRISNEDKFDDKKYEAYGIEFMSHHPLENI